MSSLQISPEFVRLDGDVYESPTFYAVRPTAPRLPSGARSLQYEPHGLYCVTDGRNQTAGPPALVPALDALIAEKVAIAADIAAWLQAQQPPPHVWTAAELEIEVDRLRDRALTAVAWNGHMVPTRGEALMLLIGRATAYAAGVRSSDSAWLMADGELAMLSQAQFLEMAGAVDLGLDTAYGKSFMLKAQIGAGLLTTPEAIDAAWDAP